MKVANYVLFIIAGIIAVFGFFVALSDGESLLVAISLASGLFIGLVCLAYLAIAAAAVVVVFCMFLLGKIIVLFAFAAVFGVLGGIFKIFGG